jgi:hypothetical protein
MKNIKNFTDFVNENFMDAPEAQKALKLLEVNKNDIFEYGLKLQRQGDKSIKWNSVVHSDLKALTFEWLKENGLFEPEGLNLWDIPVNFFCSKYWNWYLDMIKKEKGFESKEYNDFVNEASWRVIAPVFKKAEDLNTRKAAKLATYAGKSLENETINFKRSDGVELIFTFSAESILKPFNIGILMTIPRGILLAKGTMSSTDSKQIWYKDKRLIVRDKTSEAPIYFSKISDANKFFSIISESLDRAEDVNNNREYTKETLKKIISENDIRKFVYE